MTFDPKNDFDLILSHAWREVKASLALWPKGIPFRSRMVRCAIDDDDRGPFCHRVFFLTPQVSAHVHPDAFGGVVVEVFRNGQAVFTLMGNNERALNNLNSSCTSALVRLPAHTLPSGYLRIVRRIHNIAAWLDRAAAAAERHHANLLATPKQKRSLDALGALTAEAKLDGPLSVAQSASAMPLRGLASMSSGIANGTCHGGLPGTRCPAGAPGTHIRGSNGCIY